MENFVLHNPTKIIFGRNTTSAIGRETVAFGNNVLLVSGKKSIKASGIYQQIVSSLSAEGANITEHCGVQPNPLHSHVNDGIAKCKDNKCQVICAVGGGSVIDEAKAISAGALVEHDFWKFFTAKKSIKRTLPLTTVSTLAASGSEANSGMVITHDHKKQKFGFANRHLFPKTSILDPELTFTVPADYTAFGSIDAISHILEFYFTTQVKDSSVQDTLMEGLVINIMKSTARCLLDPKDYDARANLMWSASLALNGLISVGLGKIEFPMHLVEHSLSALYDVPHGAGLAVIIPSWMTHHAQKNPERIAKLGTKVFDIQRGSVADRARATHEHFAKWFKSVNAPTTLAELGISKAEISDIAASALPLAKVWRMRQVTKATVENILLNCL